MGTPIYYARSSRGHALGSDWDGIQVWREAVAEWQRAYAAFDEAASPAQVDAACHRLKAAEARIADLRDALAWERASLEDHIDWDDAEQRLLEMYDATGRWLHRLAWALAVVAVAGWWWAWR